MACWYVHSDSQGNGVSCLQGDCSQGSCFKELHVSICLLYHGYSISYPWLYRIDDNFVIKIADFGLSESVYAKSYFRLANHSKAKLPLKWMAPESLNDGIFTEKTDVVTLLQPSICRIWFNCMYSLFLVVIWSGMLGDLHRWEGSVCRCAPPSFDCNVGTWTQTGQATKCSMLWQNVRTQELRSFPCSHTCC